MATVQASTQASAQDSAQESAQRSKLQARVEQTAERLFPDGQYVSPVDVLNNLGWLPASHIDRWRQGRVPDLESGMQVTPAKVSAALSLLRRWAEDRALLPTDTPYLAATRDHRPLRFSASGTEELERAWRTHWVSPELSEAKRDRLTEAQGRPPELLVISSLKDWTCSTCGGTGPLLTMEPPGPVCLQCADLDHLVFLPSGNVALTRRAKKASGLSAVVVRFSRARRRYERQGILVEELALMEAEAQCLADDDVRSRRRERDEERRAVHDGEFEAAFAAEIGRMFPRCPDDRAAAIAAHAGARGSGRVGRSAAGRELAPGAVVAAVTASVRHVDTPYDELLMTGVGRAEARQRVEHDVREVLDGWRSPT